MSFDIDLNGIRMHFQTSAKVFSPHGLDAGTRALLTCVDFQAEDKVLDLACGYGIVGIYAAKCLGAEHVSMTDIDPNALALAKENIRQNGVEGITVVQSDGFKSLDESGFHKILCNPPYHTDFSVAKHFIEKGFNRLLLGGQFFMVTKRKDWYKNKFSAIFGGVSIKEIDGYYVFIAQKRTSSYAKKPTR